MSVPPETTPRAPAPAPANPEPATREPAEPEAADDLPPAGTKRWVGRRKAAVIAAVRDGRLTLDSACERYGLTIEELMSWQRLADRGGTKALRSTRLQQYRPATRRQRSRGKRKSPHSSPSG